MDENYDKVLDRIAKSANLEKDEIERRVEAKRAKLSGLISKEGAAQVIAAELGISFENEKFKIDELLPGMRKVNTSGKIIQVFPVRTFERQGKENKVANFVLADDTSNIRIVLWDVNHIELFEKDELKLGDSVEITNGSMRDNEIHLGSFSELKKCNEVFESVKEEKPVKEKVISEFSVGDVVSARAFIVQAFDLRFFEANTTTGKKITEEEKSSGAASEKRGILNVVIDDGSESIRAVIFHSVLPKLEITDYENAEAILKQKQNLLGREVVFSGNVRMNSYFNTPELIVDNIEEIDLDGVIASLE
jgi:ssDNA-binding replication factor A large subunit